GRKALKPGCTICGRAQQQTLFSLPCRKNSSFSLRPKKLKPKTGQICPVRWTIPTDVWRAEADFGNTPNCFRLIYMIKPFLNRRGFSIFIPMEKFADLDLTTPALLFPAISLLLLAYTNRFLALASLIRKLHEDYKGNPKAILW